MMKNNHTHTKSAKRIARLYPNTLGKLSLIIGEA